jgi:hypothetical protein
MLQEAKCLFFCAHFFIEMSEGVLSPTIWSKDIYASRKSQGLLRLLHRWLSLRSELSRTLVEATLRARSPFDFRLRTTDSSKPDIRP